MLASQGDRLPVSALPVDGTWPTATARREQRNLAQEIPAWDPVVASSATGARWCARTRPSAPRCTDPR